MGTAVLQSRISFPLFHIYPCHGFSWPSLSLPAYQGCCFLYAFLLGMFPFIQSHSLQSTCACSVLEISHFSPKWIMPPGKISLFVHNCQFSCTCVFTVPLRNSSFPPIVGVFRPLPSSTDLKRSSIKKIGCRYSASSHKQNYSMAHSAVEENPVLRRHHPQCSLTDFTPQAVCKWKNYCPVTLQSVLYFGMASIYPFHIRLLVDFHQAGSQSIGNIWLLGLMVLSVSAFSNGFSMWETRM